LLIHLIVALPLLLADAIGPAAERPWTPRAFTCFRPAHGCYIQRCCELSLAVFTRDEPDSGVREVRAIGEMDATPARVFEVITDYTHYTEFMPYAVGAKLVSDVNGEPVVWGMIDPPVISRRDWVTRSKIEKHRPDGVFRTSWVPELVEGPPPLPGVIRLVRNSGSWTLEPIDGGKRTRATYQLATDPGGDVPAFVVKAVNTDGLPDLFKAIKDRTASGASHAPANQGK
jgi:uncharacterized protein YndB with AHSA1/START domain